MAAHDTIPQGESLNDLLDRAHEDLVAHRTDSAIEHLERALALDFDHPDVATTLKYANFWKEREALLQQIGSEFEQGEYLLSQWNTFSRFVERVGRASEPWMASIRAHVFGMAMERFESLLDTSGGADAELLLRIGRCHKALGHYDIARQRLEQAGTHRRDDAAILAELADCYALINETQKAKAFFREAFFISPSRIDLDSLESPLIRRLIDRVRDEGYEQPVLAEWVPIYGVVYGVFSVKRELRSIEYGKLRQSIYALEREVHEHGNTEIDSAKKARLINRYFWLIDHYVNTGEERSKIDEVRLKIRQLSLKAYEAFTH